MEFWYKSSYSSDSAGCVEVTFLSSGGVGVRDSKNPHEAQLRFTDSEWAAFVKGVKGGEFDV